MDNNTHNETSFTDLAPETQEAVLSALEAKDPNGGYREILEAQKNNPNAKGFVK